ncbi:hypothetical protein GCM10010156_46000 [Planobispora rosea]|uniref:Low molecular weight protein antigen 6 PH domain-containing protein n=1 Tax=Planobispora rosea TaxID=35762 RepID=A0A8J3S547_PLARO|nr:PH domain-containing protein [Planobispora rosea]GGS82061.1 hypothetical protein GCM10010156_46000 [Planobispora rosea]GIH86067.1 hypothetical protein Pro02_44750 [Planobispora rosea]
MKQVFRSKFALILGWVWVAFAAFNAVDLVVRYSGPPSLVAAAVLGVLTAVVVVTCLRPAIVLTEEGVLVRNPFRNVSVPWTAVDDVTVSHAITISSGGRAVRCWTPQTTSRERASAVRRAQRPASARGLATEPVRTAAEQAAAEALAGRTHTDWVAEQITERAEAAKRAARGPGRASGTPADAGAVPGSGPGSGPGVAPGPGAMRVTWAPLALAVLGAAIALVVAAVVVS